MRLKATACRRITAMRRITPIPSSRLCNKVSYEKEKPPGSFPMRGGEHDVKRPCLARGPG